MKLEFSKKPFEYRKCIVHESRIIEDTAEVIIPDTCPDGETVLFTEGMVFLRGKDVSDETVNLSLGVSASTMVRPEGRETPEILEVYIPMSIKLNNGTIHMGQACHTQVRLKRLESYLVNPRKIMVRATVEAEIWVYEQVHEEHSIGCEQKGVEYLTETFPVRVIKAMGEKTYTVEDEVMLPDQIQLSKICGAQATLHHADKRMAGSKAVLKGTAEINILYLDQNDRIKTTNGQMDFAQYVDLEEYTEGEDLELCSQLAGFELEPDMDGSGLRAVMQICTVAKLWGKEEIIAVTDLYSIMGEAEFEKKRYHYDSLLDMQELNAAGNCAWEDQGEVPVCHFCIPMECRQEKKGETVICTIPVTIHALFEDHGGQLSGRTVRTEMKCSSVCRDDCRLEVQFGEIQSSFRGGTVKINGEVHIKTFCVTELDEVASGSVSVETNNTPPGIIIVRPTPGQRLWDISKKYRSSCAAIQHANNLSGEELPREMILIPKQI